MALNAKQKLFVKEYLRDRNATRAYQAAGYPGKGAAQSASALLRNPKIQVAVEKGLAKLAEKADISAERVIKRIAEHAFDKKSLKASDILKACELLGKHFKLFTDVAEINGKLNIKPVQVVFRLPPASQERAKEGKK
jgi:phage terminase small subunit